MAGKLRPKIILMRIFVISERHAGKGRETVPLAAGSMLWPVLHVPSHVQNSRRLQHYVPGAKRVQQCATAGTRKGGTLILVRTAGADLLNSISSYIMLIFLYEY